MPRNDTLFIFVSSSGLTCTNSDNLIGKLSLDLGKTQFEMFCDNAAGMPYRAQDYTVHSLSNCQELITKQYCQHLNVLRLTVMYA